MGDSLPVEGLLRGPDAPREIGRIGQGAGAHQGGGPTQAAVFQALLDKLERRAGELEQRSRTELAPEELPGAVDEARASMQDALTLQRELIEAWRQSRHQVGPEGGAP